MPRARVFISHSSKGDLTPAETSAREVLDAVSAALAATGHYSVLLDRIALQPGDAWRARINLWVGGCDAAVVLLSEAALESDYVAYETSVLAYRATVDPGSVRVIGVLVPPVTLELLNTSRLAPQQFGERQIVEGSVDEIVARVLAELDSVTYAESPVERRARRLARLLEKVHDDDIEEAAQRVGLDVGPWLPGLDRRARLWLAVQLMSAGMEKAAAAVPVLQQEMAEATFSEVVDIIASAWVDHRSTSRIPLIARGHERIRAVSLNAEQSETARMYLECARVECNDPPGTWYLGSSNGISGDWPEEDLAGEIGRELADRLGVEPDALVAELESIDRYQPVMMALPWNPGITREVLTGLSRRFPGVTFFLLAGDTPGPARHLGRTEVEFLIPELRRGDEAAFLAERVRFLARVTPAGRRHVPPRQA